MLRRFQVFLFIGTIFVVCGCNEEVTEIPATDSTKTPKISEKQEKENKELMEGEKKRNKKAAEQGTKQKKKGKS